MAISLIFSETLPVACISLSMGGPYFLAFLGQQSQAWKDKYILSYTSLDGAFGGSPSAISALVSLNGTLILSRGLLGILLTPYHWDAGFWSGRFPNPSAMRAVIQSWPSIVWMLPISQVHIHPLHPSTRAELTCDF